jgi:aryl-alcohol dehydrogenase-like predicted oxidoreductase
MRVRRLGSNGPDISGVGFGAWEAGGDAWGPNESDDQAVEAMRAALDAGITWIDTAESYGDGKSEELVARSIEGRRDEVVVATKVAPRPEGTGFRRDEVRAACEASLKRLGIDSIDLYQLHWPDDDVLVEETWEAMAGLVDDGLVRNIGVSNFGEDLIGRCEAIRHVDSLQPHFSMLHLRNRDLIRWCGDRGTGVVTYGSLAYGFLTGAITAETEFDAQDWRSGKLEKGEYYRRFFAKGKKERSLAVVDALRPIADRLGISLSQVALAWILHQSGVTSAIAGSRNPRHVRDNAQAGRIELDRDTLREIEEGVLPLGPAFGDP